VKDTVGAGGIGIGAGIGVGAGGYSVLTTQYTAKCATTRTTSDASAIERISIVSLSFFVS
jgi:hypothetical protein